MVHLVRNHERGNGTPFADPDSRLRPHRVGWHHQPRVRSPRRRVAGVVPEPQRHDPQLLRRADAVGLVADVRGDDPGQRTRHGRRGASRVRVRRPGRRHERCRAAHPTGALLPRGALRRPGVRDRLPHRGRHPERVLPLRAPRRGDLTAGPPADDGDRRGGRSSTPRRPGRRGRSATGSTSTTPTPALARPRPSPRGRRRAAPRSPGARARGSATAGRTSSRPAAGPVGQGQVFEYNPRRDELSVLFASPAAAVLNAPDNVTVSPAAGSCCARTGRGTSSSTASTPTARSSPSP